MFRRLKEKISEEVSKSPLRLQSSVQTLGQLSPFKEGEAKSNQDAAKESTTNNSNLIDLQEGDSSLLDTSENQQFSITDDDGDVSAPTSPSSRPTEFTNVDLSEKDAGVLEVTTDHQQSIAPLKSPALSHSLFPVYRPSTPVYHIQSDLESASEVEDSGIHLESISKERLYQAFQTAKSRYLSYKSRYSNAVKAYKEQVEEVGKIKVVLAETQDRALRRVSELKEQSQLDLKAKAHLEDTYRVNLEEKDQLISVLHTQIRLLKNGEEIKETVVKEDDQPLIDLEQQGDSVENNEKEDDLRQKVKRYEETIVKLKGFLKSCKETITKNREITTRLNAEKEDIKNQFENAIVRLSELENKSSLKDTELQNAKTEAQEEINRLKKNEAERGLQVAEYKRSMHDEMTMKEREMEGLKIQLKEMVSKNEELRKSLETKVKQLNELEANDSTVAKLQQSLEQLEKANEEEKQSLLQEMSRSKTAAMELMQQEYQRNLKDLKRENDEIVDKLEFEWQGKFRSKVEELEMQITSENESKASLEKQLQEALSQVEEGKNLEDQVANLQLQLKTLQTSCEEVTTLKNDCLELQSKFSNEERLKQESLLLNEELQVQLNQCLEKLESERSTMRQKEAEEKDNEKELHANETELNEVKVKLEAEKNLVKDLNNRILQLKASHGEDMTVLKNVYLNLQAKLSDEQEFKHGLSKLSEELQVQLGEALQMLAGKCDAVKFMEADEKDNEGALYTSELELNGLTGKLEEKKNLVKVLTETMFRLSEELLSARQQLTLEVDNSKNECHNLKAELEMSKAQLESTVTKYEQDLNEVNSKILTKESEIQSLKLQMEMHEDNIRKMSTESEDLQGKLSSLAEERDQLKFKFDEHLQSAEEIEIKLKENHNRKLTDLKNKTQESLNVCKEQIKELQGELENERSSFQNTSEKFNIKIKELEDLLLVECSKNEQYEQKLQEYTNNLNSVEEREQFELLQMRNENEKLQQGINVAESNLSLCQTELDSLKSSSEELLVKLSGINNDVLEKDRQLLLLTEKYATLQDETNVIIETLQLDSEVERLAKLESQPNKLSQEIKNVCETLRDRCLQVESASKDAEGRVGEELNILKEQVAQLELQKVGFINEIQSAQEELRKIREENVELRINIDELNSEITARQQEVRCLQDQNCNIGELEFRLKADEETINQLTENLQKQQEDYSNQAIELEKYLSAHNVLQNEISTLKAEHLKAAENVNQEKINFESQLMTLKEENDQLWQAKLNTLSEEHQAKLNDLKKRAENKLGQIKKQKLDEAEKIKDELSNRIKNLEQELTENEIRYTEIMHKSESDTSTILELNRQLELLKSNHETEIVSAMDELKAAKTELQQEKDKLCLEIERKNTQLDESLITAQINCTKMETEISSLQESFDKAKLEWEEREQELVQSLTSLQADVSANELSKELLRKEIEELKSEFERTSKSKEEEYKSKIKEMLEDFTITASARNEEERQTLADSIERTMAEDEQMRKEYNEQIIEMQKELNEKDELVEQLIEEKQKVKKEMEDELLVVAEKNDEKLTLLRREHQQQLENLEKKLKANMKRELEYQSRSHEEEVRGLSDEWDHERKFFTETDLNSMAKIDIVQEDLQQQAQLATSAVESGAHSAELLQRQIRLLQNQIETLKEQHKSEVNELRHIYNMSNHSVPPNLYEKNQLRDNHLETLEIEYLKNILYEYMMGKETMVLAKVIAAVLKFDDDQTRKILEKEEGRTGLATGSLVQLLK